MRFESKGKKKKEDEGLTGTSYYLFSYHSSPVVPAVLVLELKIPPPKRLFSCGQTGTVIAHPPREVRGWRCVSWVEKGGWEKRRILHSSGMWREGTATWGKALSLISKWHTELVHRAGNVLRATIRLGGLEGQDDIHNQSGKGIDGIQDTLLSKCGTLAYWIF